MVKISKGGLLVHIIPTVQQGCVTMFGFNVRITFVLRYSNLLNAIYNYSCAHGHTKYGNNTKWEKANPNVKK